MTEENCNPTEEPAGGDSSGTTDPTQGPGGEEPLKGGADGKSKALGGKGLGDNVKTDRSERAYD